MKRLRNFIFVFSVCLLFSESLGCIAPVSTRQSSFTTEDAKAILQLAINDKWKGHHISGLIQFKGPADQLTSDAAGGLIYIWRESFTQQRRVRIQSPVSRTPKKTKTRGAVRWNPLTEQWEFESQTGPVDTPPDAAEVLSQLHRQRRIETYKEHFRIMVYVRADGTIYHCLVK